MHERSEFWIALISFVSFLIAIIWIRSARKSRHIGGSFLVLEPNSKQKKKVKLIGLSAWQKRRMKENLEKPWQELKPELSLNADQTFDWQPLKNSNGWQFIKGDVLLISCEKKSVFIEREFSITMGPKKVS